MIIAGVVLAAGRGARFGGAKQYAEVAGHRLVDRAVDLVRRRAAHVTVVLPPGDPWTGPPVDAIAFGGSSRTESLRNALAVVPAEAEAVIVHDAIRPLATVELLDRLVAALCDDVDAAMPCWQPPDPIKRADAGDGLQHVGREGFVIGGTPLICRAGSLRAAFAAFATIDVEETIAIERRGGVVRMVEGDRWSQHIVTPEDRLLAEAILALRAQTNP
jgi:2-C-methyl-D-erythritol 4-phosphate cytidylyltransferase